MADVASPPPGQTSRAMPRETVATFLALVAAAVLIGAAGVYFLYGYTADRQIDPVADLSPGNPDQRTSVLTPAGSQQDSPQSPSASQSQSPQSQSIQTQQSDAVTASANAASPENDPVLREIERRLAEDAARLAERARLASDSPLTPAVVDMAERLSRRRAADSETAEEPDTSPTLTPSETRNQSATDTVEFAATSPEPDGPPTFLLARGSVIPTVLESRIDSELPGLVRAKVAETVFDTITGRHALIPRGSWLVGTYGNNGQVGQRRMTITWTDLRLPDGTAVPLSGFGTLGDDGASGVRGKRSTGLIPALGAAVLFDLAGNATQIITGSAPEQPQSDLAAILGAATGSAVTRVGERHAGELLSRGTRFRVRPGTRMNVLVDQDIELTALPPAWGN